MSDQSKDEVVLERMKDLGEELVILVDDDAIFCEALIRLLRTVGRESVAFTSAADLINAHLPDRPGCMVLDVRLPGMSGLDFQAQLKASGSQLPVIFLTGYGDIAMSVRAMKAGAVDFLIKPVRDQDLLDAIHTAIERDRMRRCAELEVKQVAKLVARLTPREREVACRVAQGFMNKEIAYELGISEITVKLHRGSVMRKMEARSLSELIRKTQLLGLRSISAPHETFVGVSFARVESPQLDVPNSHPGGLRALDRRRMTGSAG